MSTEDEDFAALFEQSQAGGPPPGGKRLSPGKVIDGIVVAVGDDAIYVDVGTRSEGILERRHMPENAEMPKVGDRIRATVSEHRRPDAPPQLVMSLRGAGLDVDALRDAAAAGTPVEGEFTKAVKAGLEVTVGGVRAFCPASQVEIGYTGDLEVYVGQRHFFRVMEVKDSRSVIVSRRALLEAERVAAGERLAKTLEEGAEMEGIVQSVKPYGAFVDLGGLTGLVHVSEIAHGRVASPEDVVSAGDKVRVKVLSIASAPSGEAKDAKISLSMRALIQPPPQAAGGKAGEIITATVSKVESYGILVDTPAGSGLVPNGELALPPGSDPRRAYSAGDNLDVVAIGKDGGGRIRFSAKAVGEVEARKAFEQFKGKGKGKDKALGSLGDLLAGKFDDLPDRKVPDSTPKKR